MIAGRARSPRPAAPGRPTTCSGSRRAISSPTTRRRQASARRDDSVAVTGRVSARRIGLALAVCALTASAAAGHAVLPPLPPGRYKVLWRVLSIDADVTEGGFSFRIE